MNCNQYQDDIPAYIRKELKGEQRIFIKSHLKACLDCRDEFLKQIQLYYILDREEVLEPAIKNSQEFNKNVLNQIHHPKKNTLNRRWIYYAAAATLLIGIAIGRFLIPDKSNQNVTTKQDTQSLNQLIASEDWSRLEILLSNKDELDRYATDAVPIHILLDKLAALQKMGIKSLPMAYPSYAKNTKSAEPVQREPQIHISVNDFIRLLEQARQQRSQITLKEVSSILISL
jgi:hypothetical protein